MVISSTNNAVAINAIKNALESKDAHKIIDAGTLIGATGSVFAVKAALEAFVKDGTLPATTVAPASRPIAPPVGPVAASDRPVDDGRPAPCQLPAPVVEGPVANPLQNGVGAPMLCVVENVNGVLTYRPATVAETLGSLFGRCSNGAEFGSLCDAVDGACEASMDRLGLKFKDGVYVDTPAPAHAPVKVEVVTLQAAEPAAPSKGKGKNKGKDKPAPRPLCTATTSAGAACKGKALEGKDVCRAHNGKIVTSRTIAEEHKAKNAPAPAPAPTTVDDASIDQLKVALASKLGVSLSDLTAALELLK
jgi:hypothetical protein